MIKGIHHKCNEMPNKYKVAMYYNTDRKEYIWYVKEFCDDRPYIVQGINNCPFCGKILNLGAGNNDNSRACM